MTIAPPTGSARAIPRRHWHFSRRFGAQPKVLLPMCSSAPPRVQRPARRQLSAPKRETYQSRVFALDEALRRAKPSPFPEGRSANQVCRQAALRPIVVRLPRGPGRAVAKLLACSFAQAKFRCWPGWVAVPSAHFTHPLQRDVLPRTHAAPIVRNARPAPSIDLAPERGRTYGPPRTVGRSNAGGGRARVRVAEFVG